MIFNSSSIFDLVKESHVNFQKITANSNQKDSRTWKVYESSVEIIKYFDLAKYVQQIINETYSQPLPKKSEVTVPFRVGNSWDNVRWVKWESLSQKEKLEVNNHFAHQHGQIWNNIFGEAIIDIAFFGWGQNSYLPMDPKEYHGSDHCVRTALFCVVFAYLYDKYHPDYEVTREEASFAAAIGAGHDASRQTEVADVYDERSAETTVNYLKQWGVQDEAILLIAKNAIADKDNPNLASKSLIAKCVQNADSAEFARLNVFKIPQPKQSETDFEYSRGFLDIYKELKEIANKRGLKNGFSFEDFVFELDSLRKEMNMLIYQTHKKKTRKTLSESDNYFNGIINKITQSRYPLLNNILINIGIIPKNQNKYYQTVINYFPLALEDFHSHLIELKHQDLKATLKAKKRQDEKQKQAEKLYKDSLELIKLFKELPAESHDFRILTTVSLALEKACLLFIKIGNKERAKSVLKDALNIPLDRNLDFEFLLHSRENLVNEDDPIFLLKGSESVRRRRVRVCKKTIDERKIIEISFELTKVARKKLNKKLLLLKEDPEISISTKPSLFGKKDFSNGKYYTIKEGKVIGQHLGNETKISFEEVDICVGADPSLWNQYHLVRVIIDESSPTEKCQLALSRLGLPMVLLPSRPEDERKEALGRAIAFRYPSTIYTLDGQKHPDAVYQTLTTEQKQQIDRDVNGFRLKNVNNLTELVNPQLAEEAWKAGARALCAFLSGNIKETTKIMVNILRGGYLSRQERRQRGIVEDSFTGYWNNKQGSTNQAFVRVLPKSWFEKKICFDQFAVKGPIMIMFDVKAFEKMPYSYDKDRGGVRNPEFYLPAYVVLTTNQLPDVSFSGAEKMANRYNFPENIKHIDQTEAVQNEFMFDLSLGTEYINKLVLQNEADKYILLNELEKHRIFEINERPLSELIIVSKSLDPHMVAHFERETYLIKPHIKNK
jgi:hypothetical protein